MVEIDFLASEPNSWTKQRFLYFIYSFEKDETKYFSLHLFDICCWVSRMLTIFLKAFRISLFFKFSKNQIDVLHDSLLEKPIGTSLGLKNRKTPGVFKFRPFWGEERLPTWGEDHLPIWGEGRIPVAQTWARVPQESTLLWHKERHFGPMGRIPQLVGPNWGGGCSAAPGHMAIRLSQ